MFGSKDKKEKSKQNVQMSPKKSVGKKSYGNVYVMPNKFQGRQSTTSVKPLLFAVGILVVVIIVIAFYFFYESTKTKDPLDIEPVANTEVDSDMVVDDAVTEDDADSDNNTNRLIGDSDMVVDDPDTLIDDVDDADVTDPEDPVDDSINNPISLDPAVISSDVDRDGLTDIEEAIFGTSPSKPDSDADGFTDGSEVPGGYNPAIAAGALLVDAGYIDTIETNFIDTNFKTLYIRNWFARSLPAVKQVQITADTGENIKITVSDNAQSTSVGNWFLLNNPLVLPSQITAISVGELEGIITPSGLKIYLTDPLRKNIYTFEYIIGAGDEMRYPSIFRMIVDNFELIILDDLITDVGDSSTPSSTDSTIQ
jgi:hypothetical protein